MTEDTKARNVAREVSRAITDGHEWEIDAATAIIAAALDAARWEALDQVANFYLPASDPADLSARECCEEAVWAIRHMDKRAAKKDGTA